MQGNARHERNILPSFFATGWRLGGAAGWGRAFRVDGALGVSGPNPSGIGSDEVQYRAQFRLWRGGTDFFDHATFPSNGLAGAVSHSDRTPDLDGILDG